MIGLEDRCSTHIASAVSQVWCWDMTYLQATVIGRGFYLYLIPLGSRRCHIGTS